MCKICIFAGTTEARRLVELLSTQPVSVTACVATEYGETLLPEGGNVTVRSGRIPVDGIIQMLSDTKFDLVIDATHPYAASITESVARACAETGTEYLRLLREESDKVSDFTCVLNAEAAALFLSKTDGNILLTTGSKDLKMYSKVKDFTDRAYARAAWPRPSPRKTAPASLKCATAARPPRDRARATRPAAARAHRLYL